MTKLENEAITNDAIVKRLDALIGLFYEMTKPEKKRKLGEGDIARYLKSMELSPTEIAMILGKESATDISYCLYPKKEKSAKKGATAAQAPMKQDKINPGDSNGEDKTPVKPDRDF